MTFAWYLAKTYADVSHMEARMPVDANPLRPVRKTVTTLGFRRKPLFNPTSNQASRPNANPSAMGPVTQNFFAKGEEQEATEYENVVLDPAVEPDLEFDSFDAVPHKRRPLFIVAGVLTLAAIAGVAWKTVPSLHMRGAAVQTAAQAAVTAQPLGVEAEAASKAPAPAAPARVVVPPTPAAAATAPVPPTTAPAQAKSVVTSESTETSPVTATDQESAPRARPTAQAKDNPTKEDSVATDAPANAPAATTRRGHSSALRGYVWSAEKQALVPADEPAVAPEHSIATPEPTPAPAERRVLDSADSPRSATQPPATEPARTEAAPIIE
jgi:hypothetical protein